MNRLTAMLALAVGLLAAASSYAQTSTVEVAVEGLNCALCSEAMREQVKRAAGATDLEPRLECGRIYLEVPEGASVPEGALNFALLSNGYNLKSVRPSPQTLADVRATKDC